MFYFIMAKDGKLLKLSREELILGAGLLETEFVPGNSYLFLHALDKDYRRKDEQEMLFEKAVGLYHEWGKFGPCGDIITIHVIERCPLLTEIREYYLVNIQRVADNQEARDRDKGCTCPKECDCQNPPPDDWDGKDGCWGISNLCPEHNLYPNPDEDCPVHK